MLRSLQEGVFGANFSVKEIRLGMIPLAARLSSLISILVMKE
jgi:hypothetical protein